MTKVVCTTRNNQFTLVRIEGHAAYAQKNFDIVCAGISSIVEGTQSFFRARYRREVVINKNKLGTTFSVLDHSDKFLQTNLQMFIHQLRNVSHFYPNYVVVDFE